MIERLLAGCFLVTSFYWSLPAAPAAAVVVTVDPPSVTSEYAGSMTFTITGLANGESVRVEKFVDTNGNGNIDAGEPSTQSFQLTDGLAFSIGGVRDLNVPGDDDGLTNGQIRASLNFQAQAQANRAIGTFVYRVTSLTSAFTPATASFTITQAAGDQKITGTVTSGTSPVPGAFVLLLDARGKPVTGVYADANGAFSVNAAPGMYHLAVVETGFLFDSTSAPTVTLSAGMTAGQDLSLIPADRTISGQLTDMASGAGIAGVQLLTPSSSGLIAVVFTDAGGAFTLPVTDGQWTLQPSEGYALQKGYPEQNVEQVVDTSAGNVAGVVIQWHKATALIYGAVTDGQANPLAGIRVTADSESSDLSGTGFSDTNGNYTIAVVAGSWMVLPTSPPGAIVETATVTVADGEASRADFVVQLCTAHLRGRVIDESASPLANFRVNVCAGNQAVSCLEATTNAGGDFDACVAGGTWDLFLDSNSLAINMLIGSTITTTVTDGGEQNNLILVARHAGERISGTVTDQQTGAPLDGIHVLAAASISGADYHVLVATDANGNFSLSVSDGTWQLGLECDELMARNYTCPADQVATVPPAAVVNFTPQPLPPPCAGDCNGDGAVTVDEVLALVNFALEDAAPTDCTAGDINNDHLITIDEILAAVNRALSTCTA